MRRMAGALCAAHCMTCSACLCREATVGLSPHAVSRGSGRRARHAYVEVVRGCKGGRGTARFSLPAPRIAACCVHARRCFGQRASIVATEVRTVRSTACRIVSRCSTDLAWPSLGVQRLVHATSELAAKPYPLDCQVRTCVQEDIWPVQHLRWALVRLAAGSSGSEHRPSTSRSKTSVVRRRGAEGELVGEIEHGV